MEKIRWIFVLFVFIGLGFLTGGFYVVENTRNFIARANAVPGVVIENVWVSGSTHNGRDSGTYHPRVRFRTRAGEATEFVSKTGSTPARHRKNEEVTVLYDPDNPNSAEVKEFCSQWLLSVILGGFGVVFSLIGIGPLAWMLRQSRMHSWLHANGQRIETEFERVELDTTLTVRGMHPYRIISQWQNPGTNRMHVFKSDNIWYDPSKFIASGKIAVWIDPNNPKSYAVETSFLPQAAD